MNTTAFEIRKELKSNFPSAKFSIRSKSRKRSCSIDITWIKGPTDEEVDSITAKYRESGFYSVCTHYYTDEVAEECIRIAQNWYAEHPGVRQATFVSDLMRLRQYQEQVKGKTLENANLIMQA